MKVYKEKKAAMEMSVGTMVTIVLLMVVLVLGIFLVQRIFRSGTNAVDIIDAQIQSEINKLFSEEEKNLVIYPSSREITIRRGDSPRGFAFSVRNPSVEVQSFQFSIEADDVTRCGSQLRKEMANSWTLPSQGSFSLEPGKYMSLAEKIAFSVPENAPPCTLLYRITVRGDKGFLESASVFVTIK